MTATEQAREEHRDALGTRFIEDLARDVRHAIRQLRRSPGFALLAMLCLGLGIGVNTTMFSVLNFVLFRPMAAADPDRLILVSRGETATFSYPDYRDFRTRTRSLSGLAASWPMESDLDVGGESEFVAAEVVSANYGEVLGVLPSIGRWFVSDREPEAVISYALWERRFNLNPEILGQPIRSESQSYTIVGVAPREFIGVFAPLRTDIWVPLGTRPSLVAQLDDRARQHLMLFGRLRADRTALQAAAELNTIEAQLLAEHGAPSKISPPIVGEHVRGIPDPGNRRRTGAISAMLAAVVGLVLLIACVNVSNLLLVRGAARQREIAMRQALGASRRRLLQQLLTESLVLAVGGGICGVILALWTNTVLERSLPPVASFFAIQFDLSPDWRVIAFAAVMSLACTVLSGLAPAWRTSRASRLVTFKGEIHGGTSRRRPFGLVAQVVMSFVLLLIAGSFLEALLRMQATDPGFEVDDRLYAFAFVPSPPFTPATGHEFYVQALERLKDVPGVRRVALSSSLPLMPSGSDCVSLSGGPRITVTSGAVDSGYFETMGIGLVVGRTFATGHVLSDASSVVVNESLAARLWPDRRAIGERVWLGCEKSEALVVIGVVRNSAIRSLADPAQPHLYRPFVQQYTGGLTTILLETSTTPAGMAEPVRRALLALGQGIRVYAVQPLSAHVEKSYSSARWQATIFSGFGLLALGLAAIGLYGVIAYRVTLRTQEIGLRMALGAQRNDIFREVVSHGLAIVVIGVAIGEVLTAAVTRVVGSMQLGIRPTELSTHVVTGLIWIAVAFVACYLPAARAARVDPIVALRYE